MPATARMLLPQLQDALLSPYACAVGSALAGLGDRPSLSLFVLPKEGLAWVLSELGEEVADGVVG